MSGDRWDLDWNHVRAFSITATEGSLSAAARKLKQTQPTLSRQVAALEAQLGVTLFERLGKKLELTEIGRDLLDHTRPMSEAAEEISLVASGSRQNIAGQVSITAAEGVSHYLLPDVLSALLNAYPQLRLELVVSNQIRDLRRREADIAIRHKRPEEPDLVAKKLRDSHAYLYASKSWTIRHGLPQTAEDLSDAMFIGIDQGPRLLQALNSMGLSLKAENFRIICASTVTGWELVKRGVGLGVMIEEIGDTTPEVIRVLPNLNPIVAPMWLCTHRELHTSRRIRVVYDALSNALSK